jgi:hypothetical protein
MSDIFISYASEDRPMAERTAKALEAQGWSVWWDRNIRAGKRFSEVIQEEIGKARCMVVLWSEKSVQRDWVIEEAEEGKKRGILVPVFVDNVQPPWGFRLVQAADLTRWPGDSEAPAFQRLCSDVSDLLGRVAQPVAEKPPGPVKQEYHTEWAMSRGSMSRRWMIPAVATGVAVMLGWAAWHWWPPSHTALDPQALPTSEVAQLNLVTFGSNGPDGLCLEVYNGTPWTLKQVTVHVRLIDSINKTLVFNEMCPFRWTPLNITLPGTPIRAWRKRASVSSALTL